MVKITVIDVKSESEESMREVYFAGIITKLEKCEKLLKKIFTDLSIEIKFFDQTRLLAHGRGASYFNSHIIIKGKNKGGHDINISNFSLSCFPNCCGIGIITSNYQYYSAPFNSPEFDILKMTLKLIKTTAANFRYESVILTFPNDENSYHKLLKEKLKEERFNIINTSRRKDHDGNLLLYSCEDLEKSEIELIKLLETIK